MSAKSQQSGWDITRFMRDLCDDISKRIPHFSYIDIRRIAFSFSQTRNNREYGVFASITPLRFEKGATITIRRGKRWRIPPLNGTDGIEYLYIYRIYLPRLWDCPFEEKLTTVIHELLHISPYFNGDIRRFKGRCYAHGANQKNFDAYAQALGKHWIQRGAPSEMLEILRLNSSELIQRYGRIYGQRVIPPDLIRVDETPDERMARLRKSLEF